MPFVPVIYAEISSLESTLRQARRGREDTGGGRLATGSAFLDELYVGMTFWLWWHLLWHFLGVQSLSVSFWKLVAFGIKSKISVHKPSLFVYPFVPVIFFFFGKLFSLKITFYFSSFKGFHDQFLIWRICLWVWNLCRQDPLPLGCASSHGADLFTLIS